MKISNMKDILKVAHMSNDSVRMIGLHGIGKSQIVEQFAKENNFHIETLFLSQQEVADLIGIPETKDGVTYWTKPIWLKRMEDASKEGKHCVLFLDELSRAPLEVRQSALQLVLEGRIHEHQLPTLDGLRTLIVAADNPTDDYQTDELDPALLDRFSNFTVEIDVKDWLKWARENGISSVITDYISEFPNKLHFIPNDDNDKGSTPRSWTKLSDIIKNLEKMNIDKGILAEIFKSRLGETVGYSFLHYYNSYIKIIKPEDIREKINLKDEMSQEDLEAEAKKLRETTRDIETLATIELANKIKEKAKEDKSWYNVLTVYLDSINIEVFTGIAKDWKNDDSEFYLDWCESVPNYYIFKKTMNIIK